MNIIKNFISRNKPVFYVGFLTLIIFLFIIAASQLRRAKEKNYGPELVPSSENSDPDISLIENKSNGAIIKIVDGSEPDYVVLPESDYADTDSKYGVLTIEYSSSGLEPSYSKAILNQKVKWINNTDYNANIEQMTPFFKEFEFPVLIPANGSTEFRMYKSGLWEYRIPEADFTGKISVLKP